MPTTNPYQRGTILRFTESALRETPALRGIELRCEQDYGAILSDYIGPVLCCSIVRVADAFRPYLHHDDIGMILSTHLDMLEPVPEVTQSRRLTVRGKET